jgi:septal ring factor EnvC (AmiA/AmiB activator)
MDLKKIDIKSWFIIILGAALIISFFFGQRSHIDTHADDITLLHTNNAILLKKNDSLVSANKQITVAISEINVKLDANAKKLANTQSELDKLKKRQNEIPTYVKHLDANGLSNAFSDYLNTRTKGKNSN